ncbi:coiled-coil domain-containing protein 42 homolog [Gouania willdenowi]|uniref:coiled-coil domain-containing protein 42 homolog n=1 Tax=Gouania willdenowi TaxID=441366 RepID=UPI00105698CB|nr:coiled-coil domain-containing protein 42 homolog [Gouania willdenowi]
MKMMEMERLEAVLKERTEGVPPPNAQCESETPMTLKHRNKQVFEMLLQNEKELQENTEKAQQLQKAYDMLLKERESNDAVRKSQRERAEVFQTDAEIERLEKDYTELTARKHKLTCEVQKYSSAKEFMDCICKIIKFKDTDALVDYIDSVKYIRGQLLQREEEMQEQIDMQRKALLSLHEKHSLVMLQKNNKLSQLQSELEKARSDALAWEKEWNHIQETSAKKILTLGQIKMATLNLYEMTGAEVGEEGVDMNDTETQLDHTKMFLEVHRQIVKQYNVQ